MRIRKIYISWRPGKGHIRYLIGELKRNYAEGITFRYLIDNVRDAEREGFKHYPGLPDLNRLYTGKDGIDTLFANRVIDLSRPDSKKLLSFWEATDPEYDCFDLLALTQGWIPTDNFEFLGEYLPGTGITFVTDLANVKEMNLNNKDIEGFDSFNFRKEMSNIHDPKAIMITNNAGKDIGYIKKVHNYYFDRLGGRKPLIQLKTFRGNGIVTEVFVRIST